MKPPFFTIITCTNNSGKFLKKNIMSVAEQRFSDYEHLFVDAYSTDNTTKLIKKYKSLDSRVRLVSQPARGISNAFNVGIDNANGQYLFFLNSDDSFIDENVLGDVYNFLFQNGFPDWIYGQIRVVEETGQIVGFFPKRWIFQQSWFYLLKFFNFIPHQAVFINKKTFDKFGNFDEDLKTKMDPDLWLRIGGKTRWLFYNRVISNFLIRPGAASSGIKFKKQNIRDWQNVQKRYMNVLEFSFATLLNIVIEKLNKVRR